MITPVMKTLRFSDFKPTELVRDGVGNVFINRLGLVRILSTSLAAIKATHEKRGLKPLGRLIGGQRVYFLEDVQNYYNARN